MITIMLRTKPEIKPPQDTRQFYRILQDDEMSFYTRPAGDGNWPMVFRLEEHHFTKLTRQWQEFWFSLNRSDNFKNDYRAFLAYTDNNKAFTNGHGIINHGEQMCADFIGMRGLTLPLPAIATLVCGRNVLCGEEVKLTERQGDLHRGTWALKVQTLRSPDYSITRATHPHLIHIANTITMTVAPNGLRQCNPFPERGGRDGYDVFYPVVSSRQVYYPMNRLEKLDIGGKLPEPYNPP
jgi:hypothetical protein